MSSRPLIEIDSRSGFCHGVVSAINKAEEQLERGGILYCLGDIVHNSDEVERLQHKGLHTITHDDLGRLHDCKVLLRAHGEPPSTYAAARSHNIEIIDATCPVVLKLQQRIKAAYDTASKDTRIVIYGKQGHAEVNGLVGQTDGTAIVIDSVDDVKRLDPDCDIMLYSQTTMPLEGFRSVIEAIDRHRTPGRKFSYFDTICRQVSNRVSRLREFAAAHDVVLFVSGAKSSNGKVLCNNCREVNPSTHAVANASEVDPQWIEGAQTIGICGATSTPRWLMEQVRDHLISLTSTDNPPKQ